MEEVRCKNDFKCHVCYKTCTSKADLVRHERIHSGERPFQCDICNKSFALKSNLDRHEKTHTGEKPF